MFRVIIDYSRRLPIGNHWYGDGDSVNMPVIPGRKEQFYNVISLDPLRLPIPIEARIPRIYLPHRFDSDYGIEDLYFLIRADHVELLDPIAPEIPVYPDMMDHQPRGVSFERLEPTSDPASATFDSDQLVYPHHQLGGSPYFIQICPHEMVCPSCHQEMKFLLQFHSDGELVEFEDGGCAYYWWCGGCSVVGCHTDSL